ncbi:TlpA family protein disulfide reductase [Paenibacillus paeoniae]|uniref:TlpA family protein disulfide reductase n=1 Tax=Paenibacillus paeoniae TaxID=2292705 RepID=A0A371PL13_9BACL|nr:TlpA disulfide reductase family protein [Paenibacillus paeoniae]REK76902.1 TlpA family protein disulfide reductase [Paenibacillus paeoniae]
MRKNVIVVIALLMLVGWGLYDFNSKNKQSDQSANSMGHEIETGLKKGNRAPNFELLDMDGHPVKLSHYTGQKVILNFWATWCPPCRVEMPHMQRFYEDYGEEIVVLAVNLTNTEKKRSVVLAFIDEFGGTFPVVMDTKGELSDRYKIFAYPTSYVIDSNGIIREIFRGAIDYQTMKRATSAIN